MMQVAVAGGEPYLMPVIWYFAPPGAKLFTGVSAFSAGIWDRDTPAQAPQVGEQPPYGFPWYDGANVWNYRGICTVGTAEQFAEGLTADDLAAPVRPFPDCCVPKPPQMPDGVEVGFTLLSPGRQAVFTTPGAGSWTAPPGVTYAMVECWGAGNLGGPPSFITIFEGGGGGAYARKFLSVVPGTTYPLFVGHGTAGPPVSNAQTTFDSPARVLADCGGRRPLTPIAAPGTAARSIGDVAFDGGFAGNSFTAHGGGGGASAGPLGRGLPGPPLVPHQPGYPGGVDAGSGGDGASVAGPALNGTTPGGGGGGAGPAGPQTFGGNGKVRISF